MPSLCFLEENLNTYMIYDFRDVCKRHEKDGKQVKSVSLTEIFINCWQFFLRTLLFCSLDYSSQNYKQKFLKIYLVFQN